MKHHPEQRDGELFMGNMSKPRDRKKRETFAEAMVRQFGGVVDQPRTAWKSVRIGKVAYDTSGNVINNMVPWFIKRSEVKKTIAALPADDIRANVLSAMLIRGGT